jgi:hypothetical protein
MLSETENGGWCWCKLVRSVSRRQGQEQEAVRKRQWAVGEGSGRETGAEIIAHISFDISHLSFRNFIFIEWSQMEIEKCQMIYDQ